MTNTDLQLHFAQSNTKSTDFLRWAESIGHRPTYGEVDRHLSGVHKISKWAAIAYTCYFAQVEKAPVT